MISEKSFRRRMMRMNRDSNRKTTSRGKSLLLSLNRKLTDLPKKRPVKLIGSPRSLNSSRRDLPKKRPVKLIGSPRR